MKRMFSFLSMSFADPPPAHRAAILGSVLFLALLAFFVATSGCAHTEQGLAREQAIYRVSTNALGQAQTLIPYLPPPTNYATEVILAAVAAALAAWNTHQQRELTKLKNGNGLARCAGIKSPPVTPPHLPAS